MQRHRRSPQQFQSCFIEIFRMNYIFTIYTNTTFCPRVNRPIAPAGNRCTVKNQGPHGPGGAYLRSGVPAQDHLLQSIVLSKQ